MDNFKLGSGSGESNWTINGMMWIPVAGDKVGTMKHDGTAIEVELCYIIEERWPYDEDKNGWKFAVRDICGNRFEVNNIFMIDQTREERKKKEIDEAMDELRKKNGGFPIPIPEHSELVCEGVVIKDKSHMAPRVPLEKFREGGKIDRAMPRIVRKPPPPLKECPIIAPEHSELITSDGEILENKKDKNINDWRN